MVMSDALHPIKKELVSKDQLLFRAFQLIPLVTHFTGRTSICMKLFCALMLRMRIMKLSCGVITLP